jgi:hypothetical protein
MTPSSVDEIKAFFPGFRRCVLKTFLLLVHAVVATRSCSLYKCAEVIPGDALFDSRYKRLLRFVCMQEAEFGDLRSPYLPAFRVPIVLLAASSVIVLRGYRPYELAIREYTDQPLMPRNLAQGRLLPPFALGTAA